MLIYTVKPDSCVFGENAQGTIHERLIAKLLPVVTSNYKIMPLLGGHAQGKRKLK
jgi:hypothetical protein